MVTNYPQRLTMRSIGTGWLGFGRDGLMNGLLARIGQLVCGLSGHDEVLHFQENRVQLRCTSCGHESPGWEMAERRPRLKYEGDARRHLLIPARRPQPVIVRKSA